jgi:hypothetical protein
MSLLDKLGNWKMPGFVLSGVLSLFLASQSNMFAQERHQEQVEKSENNLQDTFYDSEFTEDIEEMTLSVENELREWPNFIKEFINQDYTSNEDDCRIKQVNLQFDRGLIGESNFLVGGYSLATYDAYEDIISLAVRPSFDISKQNIPLTHIYELKNIPKDVPETVHHELGHFLADRLGSEKGIFECNDLYTGPSFLYDFYELFEVLQESDSSFGRYIKSLNLSILCDLETAKSEATLTKLEYLQQPYIDNDANEFPLLFHQFREFFTINSNLLRAFDEERYDDLKLKLNERTTIEQYQVFENHFLNKQEVVMKSYKLGAYLLREYLVQERKDQELEGGLILPDIKEYDLGDLKLSHSLSSPPTFEEKEEHTNLVIANLRKLNRRILANRRPLKKIIGQIDNINGEAFQFLKDYAISNETDSLSLGEEENELLIQKEGREESSSILFNEWSDQVILASEKSDMLFDNYLHSKNVVGLKELTNQEIFCRGLYSLMTVYVGPTQMNQFSLEKPFLNLFAKMRWRKDSIFEPYVARYSLGLERVAAGEDPETVREDLRYMRNFRYDDREYIISGNDFSINGEIPIVDSGRD